ncbi:MAG: amino acid ABC transporter permease [Rhodospirillaceae bacterium]|nr:amino acid ABC transporter permease [Rhodospirillaceae bacterium]
MFRQYLNNERSRGYVIQVILLLALAGLVLFFIVNTIRNLEIVGLATGFGFLGDTASFDINQRIIDYSSTSTYGRAIIVGGLNTILVAILGIIMATILGFTCGVLRLSSNFLVRSTIASYIEFTRNVPVLLQIIFWWVVLLTLPKVMESISLGEFIFLNNRGIRLPSPIFGEGSLYILFSIVLSLAAAFYFVRWSRKDFESTGRQRPVYTIALGIAVLIPAIVYLNLGSPISFDVPERGRFNLIGGFNVTPELFALWIALSTYTAAFISEIVRAGILSVSKGQIEAAKSLGLPKNLITRKIIFPQALRVIIPPLTSQYLNLTKNSSLAVAIGYQDIVSVGDTVLNQSGHALEVVAIFMVFYLTLSLLTSLFMNWYNARIALVER